jgi:hypothetical protein
MVTYDNLADEVVNCFEMNYKNERGGKYKDIVVCGGDEHARMKLVDKIEGRLRVEAYVRNEENEEFDGESLVAWLGPEVREKGETSFYQFIRD